MINKKIAERLGMEIPEGEPDPLSLPVVVNKEDIVKVDNPDLPTMDDIDVKQIEGEMQLELLINTAMDQLAVLRSQMNEVEAKYRNRYVEMITMTMQTALRAIQHKNDIYAKKRKQRLEETQFKKDAKPGEAGSTNNFFFGTREDLLKALNSPRSD